MTFDHNKKAKIKSQKMELEGRIKVLIDNKKR